MYKPNSPRADEPFFALLGRDDVAPHFARAYGYYLQGHVSMAQQELAQIGVLMSTTETLPGNHPKVRSCFDMADEMKAYHHKLTLGSSIVVKSKTDEIDIQDYKEAYRVLLKIGKISQAAYELNCQHIDMIQLAMNDESGESMAELLAYMRPDENLTP